MYHAINNVLIGLNRVGGVFFDYAAAVFIQTVLLVILLFAIDLLLRKKVRAVFRYCVWLLVLVKLILPPMLSLPTGIGYWVGDHIPAAPGASNMAFDAVALEFAGPSSEMPHVRPSENLAGDDPAMARLHSALTPLTWQAVVFLLWLAGVFAFLAVLVQRIRFVKGLVAASCPAGDELTGLLEQCRRQMTVRRDIKLRLSEAIPSPAVCGLLRPIVLVPTSLVEKLSPEGLRATLIHELAHIKRGDLWVNSVQTFLQIVYFYNPFVWFANSIIRKVCEEAVDETVLVALGGQAKDYSNTLIDIGELVFWKADLGLRLIGVAESKKALQWRIRHMLNRPIPKSSKLGALGIAALLAIAAVLLPMAKAEKSNESNKTVTMENERKSAKTLHQAVADRNLAEVRRLIAEGADVNARNERDKTPLMWGLYASELTEEIAELLIEKGADVNAQEDDGWTALLHAIYGGIDKDIVRLLVNKGADVNLTTKKGETPLHYAVEMGEIDIVKLLVDKGADFNVKNQEGWTALRRAALDGRRDMVELFIGKGADTSSFHIAAFIGDLDRIKDFVERGTKVDTKDEAGWTALFWAACAGQEGVAEFLIDKNADINANDGSGQTILHQAAQAQTNAVKLVALLISRGAKIDAKDSSRENTPLHLACYAGNKEVAELLIAKGADIDAKDKYGHTPLHCAALSNHKEVAELLVSKGADVNAENNIRFTRYTPLHHAAMVDADMVEFLIDNGADVDAASGSFGRTPLHQAVITGKPRIVELLIDKGADINASDRMPGITPLAWAVRESHPEIVELLIAKGADVNAEDKIGRTPLDMAEKRGDTQIVEILQKHGAKKGSPTLVQAVISGNVEQAKLLISQGADVNATTSIMGMNLLNLSIMKGDKELVKLLIDNGANINTKTNTWDSTPLIAAINRGHPDIAKLLIAKGADINAKGRGDYTPLHRVVMNRAGMDGTTDLMELLLEKGADIEARQEHGATPLACAAYDGNTESAKFLIEHGADIEARLNDGETTPLLRSVRQEHVETTKLLLAKGANIKATWRGLTPAHLAMIGDRLSNRRANKEMVKLLIEHGLKFPEINLAAFVGDLQQVTECIARGTNIDHKDTVGFTPLYCAVCGDHIDVLKFLLSKGANANATSINNWTPLGFTWSTEMAVLLIDNGADVTIADNRGQTALHWAVNRNNHRGDKQLVELLLKSGANSNAKAASTSGSWAGWTPLHVACRNGARAMAELLLAHGGDVNSKTEKGETTLSLAQAQNHRAVVELLRQHGAKE